MVFVLSKERGEGKDSAFHDWTGGFVVFPENGARFKDNRFENRLD